MVTDCVESPGGPPEPQFSFVTFGCVVMSYCLTHHFQILMQCLPQIAHNCNTNIKTHCNRTCMKPQTILAHEMSNSNDLQWHSKQTSETITTTFHSSNLKTNPIQQKQKREIGERRMLQIPRPVLRKRWGPMNIFNHKSAPIKQITKTIGKHHLTKPLMH